jgi:hypothetical protein
VQRFVAHDRNVPTVCDPVYAQSLPLSESERELFKEQCERPPVSSLPLDPHIRKLTATKHRPHYQLALLELLEPHEQHPFQYAAANETITAMTACGSSKTCIADLEERLKATSLILVKHTSAEREGEIALLQDSEQIWAQEPLVYEAEGSSFVHVYIVPKAVTATFVAPQPNLDTLAISRFETRTNMPLSDPDRRCANIKWKKTAHEDVSARLFVDGVEIDSSKSLWLPLGTHHLTVAEVRDSRWIMGDEQIFDVDANAAETGPCEFVQLESKIPAPSVALQVSFGETCSGTLQSRVLANVGEHVEYLRESWPKAKVLKLDNTLGQLSKIFAESPTEGQLAPEVASKALQGRASNGHTRILNASIQCGDDGSAAVDFADIDVLAALSESPDAIQFQHTDLPPSEVEIITPAIMSEARAALGIPGLRFHLAVDDGGRPDFARGRAYGSLVAAGSSTPAWKDIEVMIVEAGRVAAVRELCTEIERFRSKPSTESEKAIYDRALDKKRKRRSIAYAGDWAQEDEYFVQFRGGVGTRVVATATTVGSAEPRLLSVDCINVSLPPRILISYLPIPVSFDAGIGLGFYRSRSLFAQRLQLEYQKTVQKILFVGAGAAYMTNHVLASPTELVTAWADLDHPLVQAATADNHALEWWEHGPALSGIIGFRYPMLFVLGAGPNPVLSLEGALGAGPSMRFFRYSRATMALAHQTGSVADLRRFRMDFDTWATVRLHVRMGAAPAWVGLGFFAMASDFGNRRNPKYPSETHKMLEIHAGFALSFTWEVQGVRR